MNDAPAPTPPMPPGAAEAFDALPPPATVEAPSPARRGERHTPHDASLLEGILDAHERRAWALEPTTPDAAWQLCCDVAQAKIHGVTSPEDALARVMIGRPLGLPAMASIQGIALIWNENAKPPTNLTVMYAKTKLGLLLSRPDKIAYIRPKGVQSATSATWCGKRVGPHAEEQESTFTIEDAETAGLVNRGKDANAKAANNYNKHPKAMLQWRAVGRLCDTLGADILTGIATREDLEDEIADQKARQSAADEILARVPLKDLEAKILERGGHAPDVHGEQAASFKARITEHVKAKDKAKLKALRGDFDTWRKTAPAALVEDVLAHWNVEAAIAAPVVHQGVPAAAAKEPEAKPAAKKPTAAEGAGFGGPRPTEEKKDEPAAAGTAVPAKTCEACGVAMSGQACAACGWVVGERVPS